MTPEPSASAATKTTAVLAASWGGYGASEWLAAIGIQSWSDFAGMTAGLFSLVMLIDFLWKRFKGRTRRPRS